MGERQHIGMHGQPCRCTRHGRTKARRGCAPTCFCHGVKHAKCPNAKPCIGKCGRLTTSGETSACGYCAHCAADVRWVDLEEIRTFDAVDHVVDRLRELCAGSDTRRRSEAIEAGRRSRLEAER